MDDKHWITVDVLGGEPAVVGVGGRPRSRVSLERVLRERLPHRVVGIVRTAIADALAGEVAADGVVDLPVSERTRLLVAPIFGPDGAVHGGSVWLGTSDSEGHPGAPPAGSGFVWDTSARLIYLPEQLPPLFAPLVAGRVSITSPEFFRLFDADDSIGLIRELLSKHRSGDDFDCVARFLSPAETISAIHIVMVASDDSGRWRGIVHDVLPPAGMWPTLEAATLATLPTLSPADTHIALVDVAKMRLIRWVTDPIPDIQWKGLVDQRDTPHPDDVERIFAAAAPVLTGETRTGTVESVRLRHVGEGWTVVDGDGTLLFANAEGGGPQLGLIRLRVVGHSDDPDPVPADDSGHPGLSQP